MPPPPISQRLIKAGHRVAIAEQTESPDAARKARGGSKALVARAIVRVVTAGTLTEEALLDARADNWCVAIGEAAGGVAIAAADVSTGRFEVIDVAPRTRSTPNSRGSARRRSIAADGERASPPPRRRCARAPTSTAARARRG